jgi:hypothetical protein
MGGPVLSTYDAFRRFFCRFYLLPPEGPDEPCLEGAGGLSPGFQPWELSNQRVALKGREERAIEPDYNAPCFRTVRSAAPSGRVASGSVPRVETLG